MKQHKQFFIDLLNQLPYTLYCKNKNGEYQWGNQNYLKSRGLATVIELQQQAAFDCIKVDQAQLFSELEQQVMVSEISMITPIKQEDEPMIQRTVPWYDNGVVMGTITTSEPLNEIKAVTTNETRNLSIPQHLLALIAHEVHNPASNVYTLLEIVQIELKKLKDFFYKKANFHPVKMTEKILITSLQQHLKRINGLLKKAKQENQQSLSVLSNLINLYDLQQKGISVRFMITVLTDLLTDVIKTVHHLNDKNTEIIPFVDVSFTTAVKIDYENIFYVLQVIIGNAIRFSPINSIVIICITVLDTQYLQCTVQDFGKGFTKLQLKNLFGNLLNLKSHYQKFGLQMTQAKMRLTAGGGKLEIHSDGQKGTTVELMIPYSLDNRSHQNSLPTLKILLTEDNQVTQNLTKHLLINQGHQVTVTARAIQTITEMITHHFDLLFLDITLEDSDGINVMQKILIQKPHAARQGG